MAEHNDLGKKGEALAASYIQQKGYKIITRNYRFKHLEIDLIAKDNDVLVIIEVKTRASRFLAGPEKTVTQGKQKLLIKAANQYIIENEVDLDCRFDIISIVLNDKEMDISHLSDAFYPK